MEQLALYSKMAHLQPTDKLTNHCTPLYRPLTNHRTAPHTHSLSLIFLKQTSLFLLVTCVDLACCSFSAREGALQVWLCISWQFRHKQQHLCPQRVPTQEEVVDWHIPTANSYHSINDCSTMASSHSRQGDCRSIFVSSGCSWLWLAHLKAAAVTQDVLQHYLGLEHIQHSRNVCVTGLSGS